MLKNGEGKGFVFAPGSAELTLRAMPSAKPEIAGVDFHLTLLRGMSSCHYINLFQCHLRGQEFVWLHKKTKKDNVTCIGISGPLVVRMTNTTAFKQTEFK